MTVHPKVMPAVSVFSQSCIQPMKTHGGRRLAESTCISLLRLRSPCFLNGQFMKARFYENWSQPIKMRDNVSICGTREKSSECCAVPHKAGHLVTLLAACQGSAAEEPIAFFRLCFYLSADVGLGYCHTIIT